MATRTIYTTDLVSFEESLAFAAAAEECGDVVTEIAALFRERGNPRVLPARALAQWEPFMPRLIGEGVLIKSEIIPGRVEYELADAYRDWIPLETVQQWLREALNKLPPDRYLNTIAWFELRYGHNPGVREMLARERRRLVAEPELDEYMQVLRKARALRRLRHLRADAWAELVLWLKNETDAAAIRARLSTLVGWTGTRTGKLIVTDGDAWALAQARTIRDIEFILDRLPIEEIDQSREEGLNLV